MAACKISVALYQLVSSVAETAATACAEPIAGISQNHVITPLNAIMASLVKITDWDIPQVATSGDARLDLLKNIGLNTKRILDAVIPYWAEHQAKNDIATRLRSRLSQLRDAVKEAERRRLEQDLAGKLTAIETTFDF